MGMAVRGEPGIRFVHIHCKDAARVGHFYSTHFNTPVVLGRAGSLAAVCVGPTVHLIFDSSRAGYWGSAANVEAVERSRGLHICIYICEFKRVYEALKARGLIWTNPRFAHLDKCDTYEEASADRQLRFRSVCDPDTG